MPIAFEVTLQFSSGSVWAASPTSVPTASSMQRIVSVNSDAESTLVSGSLIGPSNVQAITDMDVLFSQSMISGSLLGPANAVALSEMPEEEQNASTTTPGNPSPSEGAIQVDWNVFDVVVEETPVATPVTSDRDATRFKKAYSFTRQQPVRVRVYRR